MAFRAATEDEIKDLVQRLCRPTTASKAARKGFDPQDCHIAYLRQTDPDALSQRSGSSSSEDVHVIVARLSRPTTASVAARAGFDAQERHIEYLKQTDPLYPPKFSIVTDADQLTEVVGRVTRATSASRASAHDFDAQRCHIEYIKLTDRLYPGHKAYENSGNIKSRSFVPVTNDELSEIVSRLCRSTVASEGGKSYKGRVFIYWQMPKTKTNVVLPNMEKKFKGAKRLPSDVLRESSARLSVLPKRLQKKQGS